MSKSVGQKAYDMYVSIKEGMTDGDTAISPQEEAIVFLWEFAERLVQEKGELEKLVDVQQQIKAHYAHRLDMMHTKAIKAERGTTVLSPAELIQLLAATDGTTIQ